MTSDLAIAQGQDTEYSLMTDSVWPVPRETERQGESGRERERESRVGEGGRIVCQLPI